ncbi:nucleotide sugar dehydrogenase [Prochlorococcus marinus]|uniref:nucleotide sugar dehydrogenase n=1 Tax=Prochlorococcus marinus TaxID=1219 RepID=UPI001ADCAC14|nr:nucleotide sugar dehydrogenase [Prochlorococcus marinus]MBO8219540.1 nucleotide sugar dehydrogenase [Prochlorococcus marinus CUG1416]MBW3051911.1 Vi polysaccharide biosynthesis protein VipA/TviB [Prochlorococcus marinus str. MU1416]
MHLLPKLNNCKVTIVGLGYVGLPLAVQIDKTLNCHKTGQKLRRKIVGFDINQERISELKKGFDRTNEVKDNDLINGNNISFTNLESEIENSDVYIITVPTPIDSFNNPNLKPIEIASKLIGKTLKIRRDNELIKNIPIVLFESTVYPGLTQEICIPIIEAEMVGKVNKDFLCGYSPERINPGDRGRSIGDIVKITSGMDEITANWVDSFYASFIEAGTHKAKSIKIAETAKVIENTQRDLNIALVNELAIICRKLNIDTLDVLEAANTKWNFLDFRPGLVGGHCIGVDPYYLTHRATLAGYSPGVVLAGRRINNYMGDWIIEELVSVMTSEGFTLSRSTFLILGLTFKENCPDMRNSGVIKLIQKIKSYGISIVVVDPFIEKTDKNLPKKIDFYNKIPTNQKFEAIIAAVAHEQFKLLKTEFFKQLIVEKGKFVDIKGIIPRELNPIRL